MGGSDVKMRDFHGWKMHECQRKYDEEMVMVIG